MKIILPSKKNEQEEDDDDEEEDAVVVVCSRPLQRRNVAIIPQHAQTQTRIRGGENEGHGGDAPEMPGHQHAWAISTFQCNSA